MTEQLLFTEDFSVGNLSPAVLNWLVLNVRHGECILEFGSGRSSRELSKFFDLTSIEHDHAFVDRSYAKVKYIIAPLEKGKYSKTDMAKALSVPYAVVILDGPPANLWEKRFSRLGFLNLKDSLIGNPILVIDDAERIGEFFIVLIIGLLNKHLTLISADSKACVVLTPTVKHSSALFSRDFWILLIMAAPNLLRELIRPFVELCNIQRKST